ncbi:unnamed protein product [Coffea canephora]|uniref:TmcB/TmcC TPR repeats domain-containing protein n=1 Tax=Coffea canephora TaxID=49390 RepID=A0A068UWX9_COFCA|nr:unnamed protein product [Coffea canephora]
MKAMIVRTGSGSFPARNWTPPSPSSPRISVSMPARESDKKSGGSSPSISLHTDLSRRNIRRASSEPDMMRSAREGVKSTSRSELGSRALVARIPEEEDESTGSLTVVESPRARGSNAGGWPQRAMPLEEVEFPGGGIGKNWNSGGGGRDEFGTGGNADLSKIGAYYEEMIKSNPSNPLLLRNYGKFLHEVEGDLGRAEEYYGRAILASPGDGEVLSLYGNLIWENERDESRAKCYFDQAVQAAPDDCMVLGSYAHFMWEAEDEDDDDDNDGDIVAAPAAAAVVESF